MVTLFQGASNILEPSRCLVSDGRTVSAVDIRAEQVGPRVLHFPPPLFFQGLSTSLFPTVFDSVPTLHPLYTHSTPRYWSLAAMSAGHLLIVHLFRSCL